MYVSKSYNSHKIIVRGHRHMEKPCKIIIIILVLSPEIWYVTGTAFWARLTFFAPQDTLQKALDCLKLLPSKSTLNFVNISILISGDLCGNGCRRKARISSCTTARPKQAIRLELYLLALYLSVTTACTWFKF